MGEWISVKEKLPKEDGYYLVSYDLGNMGKLTPLRYFYSGCPEAFTATGITHWMPIPEPPEEK